MEKKRKLMIEQKKLNRILADFFKANKIKNFRLISLGNSIAARYTMTGPIVPLFFRNRTLKKIIRENGIKLVRYHFARA